MSNNEVPEPWRSRLVERGFTDPRYRDDRPSLSQLADAMGMHTSTVSSAIAGRRRASATTVVRLSEQLGSDVATWLGHPQVQPWQPPAESALLSDRQRKAIEELIVSMTERQEHGHDQAPMSHAAGSAATDDTPAPPTEQDVRDAGGYGLAAKHAPRERDFDDQSEVEE